MCYAWTEDETQVFELDVDRFGLELDHAELNKKKQILMTLLKTYWYFQVWSDCTFKNKRYFVVHKEVVEFVWTQIDVL